MSEDNSFICQTCGQRHEGLPTDFGFRLPDEVHELTYLDQYRRARRNSDLCTLDESRYFIRAVLPLPMPETDNEFRWGVWVEVSKPSHDLYVEKFDDAAEDEPRFPGIVVNAIPGYDGTIGLSVDVQLGAEGERPALYFPAATTHALALEQRSGISRKRHHDILESTGFFDRPEEGQGDE